MLNINEDLLLTDFFTPSKQRTIDYIVLHHIAVSCPKQAVQMLIDHQVSAHFLIDLDGTIFRLVYEHNIAYHAGVSYWQGCNSLNKNSLGIEFINPNPNFLLFSQAQLQSAISLIKKLMNDYNINYKNIIGHSDIAYFANSNLLNRKQDPSALFDWQLLANNGIGIYPNIFCPQDRVEFKLGDSAKKISTVKQKLALLGYKVDDFSNIFDCSLLALAIVFNRHFNNNHTTEFNNQYWYKSSDLALDYLVNGW
jgi:N-acetyl-anhydromuramyl-L-alanine amidase AmpD